MDTDSDCVVVVIVNGSGGSWDSGSAQNVQRHAHTPTPIHHQQWQPIRDDSRNIERGKIVSQSFHSFSLRAIASFVRVTFEEYVL